MKAFGKETGLDRVEVVLIVTIMAIVSALAFGLVDRYLNSQSLKIRCAAIDAIVFRENMCVKLIAPNTFTIYPAPAEK